MVVCVAVRCEAGGGRKLVLPVSALRFCCGRVRRHGDR